MDQINTIELTDPDVFPDDGVLRRVLGDGYRWYTELLEVFRNLGLTLEWRYYRDGKAWLAKVQHKKRTIVWMSAWKGFIQATVYVSEKDTPGLWTLGLDEVVLERIRATKKVGKSQPCTLHVDGPPALAALVPLIRYKIACR